MSFMECVERCFRTLWAVLEAMEEGPDDYANRQITLLHQRLRKLENNQSNSAGEIFEE